MANAPIICRDSGVSTSANPNKQQRAVRAYSPLLFYMPRRSNQAPPLTKKMGDVKENNSTHFKLT